MENNDPPPSPVTIPWLLPDGFRNNNHGFRNGPVRIFRVRWSCVLGFPLGTLVVGRGARFDGVFWAVACDVRMFRLVLSACYLLRSVSGFCAGLVHLPRSRGSSGYGSTHMGDIDVIVQLSITEVNAYTFF